MPETVKTYDLGYAIVRVREDESKKEELRETIINAAKEFYMAIQRHERNAGRS